MGGTVNEALSSLNGQIITELQLRAYGSIGYWSATLCATSSEFVTIRAMKAPGTPFETSTLRFSKGIEEPPDADEFPLSTYSIAVSANMIMLIERDEWIENGAKQTGPLDSAPEDSPSTRVVCGIALQDLDAGHSVLFFLDDIPGVIGVYATRQEIAHYMNRYSASFI